MNDAQTAYITAKLDYEAALTTESDDIFDQITNVYLDAEFTLVEWALGCVEATGEMPPADLELLRNNWTRPPYTERIIELALRLNAESVR